MNTDVLLRADVLFVSVILPIIVVIGGWTAVKLHERWLKRELARERAESHEKS